MKTKFLLLLFTLSFAPIAISAQTEFVSGGFTYRVLDDNTVALARVPVETEGAVVVPTEVSDGGKRYTVTKINSGDDNCSIDVDQSDVEERVLPARQLIGHIRLYIEEKGKTR